LFQYTILSIIYVAFFRNSLFSDVHRHVDIVTHYKYKAAGARKMENPYGPEHMGERGNK